MRLVPLWALLAIAVAATAHAQPASAPNTPSPGQIETAALAFEDAVNLRDVDEIDALVNGIALFQRAVHGLAYDEEMLSIARDSFLERLSLGTTLTQNLGVTGDYTFLSVVERAGEQRARFRFVADNETVNYHDVAFEVDAPGLARVVDIYPFTTGEDMSRTMSRTLVSIMAPDGTGYAETDSISEYLRAFRQGEYARVAEMYPTLHATEKSRKMLAITFVIASSHLGDAAYTKALDHFSSLYESDPALDLLQIDRYYLDEDYSGALAAVDRLDRAVGGDPYLDVYRVTAYYGRGDLDKALAATDRLVEAFPLWDGGFSRRIDIALEQEDHALVLHDMILLESDFGWEFDALLIQKNWPAFASSPQFKTWTQRMDKK